MLPTLTLPAAPVHQGIAVCPSDLALINARFERYGFAPAPLRPEAGSRVVGQFEDWHFRSVYQPIVPLDRGQVESYAVEALARVKSHNGTPLPPAILFAAETSPRRTVFLDRLLRCLHLLNFQRQAPASILKLFLNVNAQHLVNVDERHGQFFAEVLEILGFPPARVCLEVVEDAVSDPLRLLEAVNRYRELGFSIALDDFGQGASNLERVWLLQPDYVKLDKKLMCQALMHPALHDKLGRVVDILHQHGAKVVGEGIESERQLDIAHAVGCDFAQGYYLGRPAEALPVAWPAAGCASPSPSNG